MNAPSPEYAVLTGDIVASTQIPPAQLRQLFTAMHRAVQKFATQFPRTVVGDFCVTQGDRWQVALRRATYSLRLLIILAATARQLGFITRISLGVGAVDKIVKNNLTASTGEAFTLSGRNLENLEKAAYRKQFWQLAGKNICVHQKNLGALLGDLAHAWTVEQARAILFALDACSHETIARKLKVKRQNVGKRLFAAKWNYFKSFLESSENL